MKRFLLLACVVFLFSCEEKKIDKIADFQTYFETSNGQETPTYKEIIDFYIRLGREFPEINIQTMGKTDSGLPLHMVTFNPEGDFNFQKLAKEKTILFINNGIHPGESDGIDATMMLFRDLATEKIKPPKNTVLVTIPVYNIGGALNRNSTTRVNQNGPKEYGFRGNARNYDLNRDFIKMDTENARSFAEIFHLVSPDIFVDTHVSNGADYQYALTHLFTQHNKLGGKLGAYLHNELRPQLEDKLAKDGWNITPYVNVFNRVPETGFSQFYDSPRYSTGYTTLWNTLGMMVETHMLKPYKQRVEGTYELLKDMIGIAEKDGKKIKELRQEAFADQQEIKEFHLNWKPDTTQTRTLHFKGFEADTLASAISGQPRLKYDESRPFTKDVPYEDTFVPTDTVTVPQAYFIPQGWAKNILPLLDANKITYKTLEKDSTYTVEAYHILDYGTSKRPFEGHYPHYGTKVSKTLEKVNFHQGDYIVPVRQRGLRYLLQTMEPQGGDSFFAWNFFDTVLQEKEHFSPYVFEDLALNLIQKDSVLRVTLDQKKLDDPEFAKNGMAQLEWIYAHSDYYEKAYMAYPIYRLPEANGSVGE